MINLMNINKTYAGKQALANVTMNISKGACFGLVGPNGAGKSTLIKVISSVIKDYEGKIQFSSNQIKIGYVPQDIALEESVTAYDNLRFFGKIYGLRGKELTKRVDEVLLEIGLKERGKDKVMTFSGGMKRRLNIGCALLHKPSLIIMDEPTVGVDPQSRRYIFEMIDQLKSHGSTIIYASHYMEEIEQICDEAAFIDNGQIIEMGEISYLLSKHATSSIYVKGERCIPSSFNLNNITKDKDGGYVIMTNHPLNTMEKVISFCNSQNGKIERLELVQPRLEDIFFSLTGSKLRD
ncbi:ABC transporter ATP-binding protein [Bacillus sp. JCM 19034]|uniref:ABC transporter ATP-binding protein n=1 Tax=Bacillus sp. JCM 19034 TaxID=1481928 RepID=UPI0007806F35|nr:ABC transporter ATP-binding protein [Bacillus sp. JCM 19034]